MTRAVKLGRGTDGVTRDGHPVDRIGIEKRVAEDAEPKRKAANFLAFAIGGNALIREALLQRGDFQFQPVCTVIPGTAKAASQKHDYRDQQPELPHRGTSLAHLGIGLVFRHGLAHP